MKFIAAAFLAVLTATPAGAISRYNSVSRPCASMQQTVAAEGAAILRYPARSGAVLYDRYVSGNSQCGVGSYATPAFVPTKDNPRCPLLVCASSSDLNPGLK